MAVRASLDEGDRPSPYPAYLLLSLVDDDDIRDIGKHDFRSVQPILTNAKRSKFCLPNLNKNAG